MLPSRYASARVFAFAVTLCLAPALEADITLRYDSKLSVDQTLPPQLADAMLAGASATLANWKVIEQFQDRRIHIVSGKADIILDPAKREYEVRDDRRRQYITIPIDRVEEALDRATASPADTRTQFLLTSYAEGKRTGGSTLIHGVAAQERSLTLTFDYVMGAVSTPLRMTLRVWRSKSSEAQRVAWVQEAAGGQAALHEAVDPMIGHMRAYRRFPRMGERIGAFIRDVRADSSTLTLRTRIEIYMPEVNAMLSQRLPSGKVSGVPILWIDQELAEVSAEPLADSVFRMPEGYRAITPRNVVTEAPTPRPSARQADGAADVPFNMVSRIQPVYPPEAKAAGIQGTVKFDAVINRDGTVRSLQPLSGPQPLVQAAMDAIWHWVYKPTLLNGEPIDIRTTIEVPFRQ